MLMVAHMTAAMLHQCEFPDRAQICDYYYYYYFKFLCLLNESSVCMCVCLCLYMHICIYRLLGGVYGGITLGGTNYRYA